MQATQKRRMWKVAMVHFALTAFVLLFFILVGSGLIPDTDAKNQSLIFLGKFLFSVLQPQFWIFPTFMDVESFFASISEISIFLSWTAFLICFFSIPLWSFCFGWIWVKLIFPNRKSLNHQS